MKLQSKNPHFLKKDFLKVENGGGTTLLSERRARQAWQHIAFYDWVKYRNLKAQIVYIDDGKLPLWGNALQRYQNDSSIRVPIPLTF